MNRTFLLWQEADISKVGGQVLLATLDPTPNPTVSCSAIDRRAFVHHLDRPLR